MKKVKKYKSTKARISELRDDVVSYGNIPQSEIAIYETSDHQMQVNVRFEEETV